jgi:hypothetical protein
MLTSDSGKCHLCDLLSSQNVKGEEWMILACLFKQYALKNGEGNEYHCWTSEFGEGREAVGILRLIVPAFVT